MLEASASRLTLMTHSWESGSWLAWPRRLLMLERLSLEEQLRPMGGGAEGWRGGGVERWMGGGMEVMEGGDTIVAGAGALAR